MRLLPLEPLEAGHLAFTHVLFRSFYCACLHCAFPYFIARAPDVTASRSADLVQKPRAFIVARHACACGSGRPNGRDRHVVFAGRRLFGGPCLAPWALHLLWGSFRYGPNIEASMHLRGRKQPRTFSRLQHHFLVTCPNAPLCTSSFCAFNSGGNGSTNEAKTRIRRFDTSGPILYADFQLHAPFTVYLRR